ncbi:IS3 family transposase [Magnetococcales bacterium HHB-1]
MSQKGDCWDSAPTERFFHTLKTEQTHHQKDQSHDEEKQDIFGYIEIFYNHQRRHSTNGYLSPADYEQLFSKAA